MSIEILNSGIKSSINLKKLWSLILSKSSKLVLRNLTSIGSGYIRNKS